MLCARKGSLQGLHTLPRRDSETNLSDRGKYAHSRAELLSSLLRCGPRKDGPCLEQGSLSIRPSPFLLSTEMNQASDTNILNLDQD